MSAPEPIWTPSPEAVANSQLTAFSRHCEAEAVRHFDWAALHRFSVSDLRRFWGLFLNWSELRTEGAPDPVCEGDDCEHARFFPGLRLSYAENLLRDLRPGDGERPAIVAC